MRSRPYDGVSREHYAINVRQHESAPMRQAKELQACKLLELSEIQTCSRKVDEVSSIDVTYPPEEVQVRLVRVKLHITVDSKLRPSSTSWQR